MLACRPSACSVGPCACINLHLVHLPRSDSGRCGCLSHLGPGPGVLFTSSWSCPDPTVALVLSPVHAHPEVSQPLVVLGVTVMDPIQSSHYPDRPIPSHRPLPLGGRGGLLPSSLRLPSAAAFFFPRPGPHLHPHPSPPFGPSFRTAGRPHSHSHSPVPVLILPPPTLMGSWVSLPSLPSSCPSPSSPVSLVLFALVVWVVWSGPVWSGFALPFSPCRALALPWLGLPWACPWCGLALTRV